MTTEQSITEKAIAIATEHGKAAASGVFDGNTSDERYREVLTWIQDGDPRQDEIRTPSLSGEFADDYSERDLAAELDIRHYADTQASPEDVNAWDEAANAYNDAVSSAFWHEVERMALEHLAVEGKPQDFIVAITTNQHGVAIGYYVDCDSAVCAEDVPASWASGDYAGWEGFEGWKSPQAIFMDSASDTPTHCAKCGRVIAHDLTSDGWQYLADALAEYLSGQRETGALVQWMDAYEDVELPEAYMDAFIQSYCHAMLWANTTDGEEPADPNGWMSGSVLWALEAFDAQSQESIREDCADFVRGMWWELGHVVSQENASQAGHDFALTRNGHGAGFWDRGLGDIGRTLTEHSKPYGESYATVNGSVAVLD